MSYPITQEFKYQDAAEAAADEVFLAALDAALAVARKYRDNVGCEPEYAPLSEYEVSLDQATAAREAAGQLAYHFGGRSWKAIHQGSLEPLQEDDFEDEEDDLVGFVG